jgi:hypothetical protein
MKLVVKEMVSHDQGPQEMALYTSLEDSTYLDRQTYRLLLLKAFLGVSKSRSKNGPPFLLNAVPGQRRL